MASNFLLCRRLDARILVPADNVLGVRESDVHPAPPLAQPWVAGVAFEDGETVVVVDIGVEPAAVGATSVQEGRRIVVLHANAGERACAAVAIDEVVDIREEDTGALQAAGELRWLRRVAGREQTLVVDTQALCDILEVGRVS